MTARYGSSPASDLELLALQAELALDDRGRLAGAWGVTIAVARAGQLLFVGSEVPDALVTALVKAVDTSPHAPAPDREPPALAACRAILEPLRAPLVVEAGPTYVFEPAVRFESRVDIVRSDASIDARLPQLNPGNWEPDEWDELLDRTLGPWAMGVVEERIASICHTPVRMTERAAECGVWTHPDFRGRGYAAAVTAAWADVLWPSGRALFYHTDAENRSSQRVAARLHLRPIGWTWRLTSAEPESGLHLHPLSLRSS